MGIQNAQRRIAELQMKLNGELEMDSFNNREISHHPIFAEMQRTVYPHYLFLLF